MTTQIEILEELKTPTLRLKTMDGVSLEYEFDNGFSAVVSCHKYSRGGPKGLLELIVIDQGEVLYPNLLASDTRFSPLLSDKAAAMLDEIESLPGPGK